MEYFIGSIATAIVFFIASRALPSFSFNNKAKNVYVTQSMAFESIAPYVYPEYNAGKWYKEPIETQSRKYVQSTGVRVVIYNDNAYWLHENTFYTATAPNGIVDQSSAKVVDVMNMNDVELKELSYIVEKLTEGTDSDSSNSGNQKF